MIQPRAYNDYMVAGFGVVGLALLIWGLITERPRKGTAFYEPASVKPPLKNSPGD